MSKKTWFEVIGQRIRAARVEAQKTQGELAYMTGMHINTIANLEAGVSDPRLGTVEVVAHVLDLDLGELLRP